jgi:hypothetical protein
MGENGYDEVNRDKKYVYDSSMEGFLPRMWSSQEKHVPEYIYWGKLKESQLYSVRTDANNQPIVGRMGEVQYDHSKPKDKPTFSQNMRFFFKYQDGYMYGR